MHSLSYKLLIFSNTVIFTRLRPGMKKFSIQSNLLRWHLWVGLFLMAVLAVLRITFIFVFKPASVSLSETIPAFFMGFRYDARVVCFVLLLFFLIGSIPHFNPFTNKLSRKIFFTLWGIVIFLLVFFYCIDFAHYSYLSARLNAQILNYLEDKTISFTMVWQSYPVIWMLLGIIAISALLLWVVIKIYSRISNRSAEIKKANRITWSVAACLFFLIAVWGRIGQFPLRWSDAFSLRGDFEANVALNPFQSFISSLRFRKSTYNLAETKKYYSLMAAHLGIDAVNSDKLNYERIDTGLKRTSRPNIVLVLCESFSGYKSSMWGNPLDATPYFNQLCSKGVFFDRCFTPAYGTARGVWATITGIPDVEIPKTASRNPAMVNQSTILNDFKEYEKMYFIGGSASWANIRGLLMDNIDDLHLYEQNDYKSPRVDVWGVSDNSLFKEAIGVLRTKQTPFFAIIQTASNHRPYTIPEADSKEMGEKKYTSDSLKKYGFGSNKEFNAFRYTDFCYQKFIEAARKEPFFNNTIFVFIGDHGIRGDAGDMFPRAWTDQGLSCEHVPLLFYAPALLEPKRISNIVSQADVLPSLAGLSGISYHNMTLGRNVFDTTVLNHPDDKRNCSFIIDHDSRDIGIVTNKYYFRQSLASGRNELVSLLDNSPVDSPLLKPQKDSLKELTQAYYQTALYMLFNNKKK